MRKKTLETCEMCSASMQNPTTIKVEGALLRVCPRCTSFGNVVKERTAVQSSKKTVGTKRRTPVRRTFTNNSRKVSKELELDEDFDAIIKKGRTKKKLNHEQLSKLSGITIASIKAFETGKMRPTDRDAKRLERELGIKLMVKMDEEMEFTERKKKKKTTLGDIAVIRKYEYDKD